MELPTTALATPSPDRSARLRAAAEALEANFLSELLKSSGLGDIPNPFGDGGEESQFASFLREAHADELVRAGGIGLAETLFRALEERTHV